MKSNINAFRGDSVNGLMLHCLIKKTGNQHNPLNHIGCLKPFQANVPFLPSRRNNRKTIDCLILSQNTERGQWPEKG